MHCNNVGISTRHEEGGRTDRTTFPRHEFLRLTNEQLNAISEPIERVMTTVPAGMGIRRGHDIYISASTLNSYL